MKNRRLFDPNQSDYAQLLKATEGRKLVVSSGSVYPHESIVPSSGVPFSFQKPSDEDYKKFCEILDTPDNFKDWLKSK